MEVLFLGQYYGSTKSRNMSTHRGMVCKVYSMVCKVYVGTVYLGVVQHGLQGIQPLAEWLRG